VPASATAAQQRSLVEARKELGALKPRLPSVVITVRGADEVAVTVDGAPISRATLGVARFLDPGTHTARVTANGFSPALAEFSLKEGEIKRVELAPIPVAAPAAGVAVAAAPPNGDVPALTPEAPASAELGSTPATMPSRDGDATWSLVGDAAAGFGLGALGLGVTALIDAGRYPSGGTAVSAQRDAHSRTELLAVTSLATGGVFSIGGVALRAVSSGHPAATRELGWGLEGLGVAGIGFGIATGLMGRHVQSHLDDVCHPACPQGEAANVTNQHTLGTWSVTGFVGGGVSAAAGIVLLLTAPGGTADNTANTAKSARSGHAFSLVLPYVDVPSNAFGLSGAF
jgi:hypothetical protein